jgi:hypothetical protein
MASVEIEIFEEDEEQRVRWWRQEALERAGYGVNLAAELARSPHVDVHQAVELLRRGCPPELALKILL